jgi:transcriptional regulator with XRE-family HTH domain
MTTVAQNIKHLRKLHQWTQGDLAEKIDIKRSLVGAYEEGRADPRLNNLTNISKLFKVSIDHLIHYDLTNFGLDQIADLRNTNLTESKILAITVDADNEEYIDLIPQRASAGYLNGYADPTYMEELPKFQLPNLPKNATYRAFEIAGDSMLPLKSGTIVIGQHVESPDVIKDGSCYVILSKEEGVVYKRVFNYIKDSGHLFLVSDNESYSPYKLEARDVIEVWEAKAFLSMDIPSNTTDSMSLNQLKDIVLDLQQEVIKLKG